MSGNDQEKREGLPEDIAEALREVSKSSKRWCKLAMVVAAGGSIVMIFGLPFVSLKDHSLFVGGMIVVAGLAVFVLDTVRCVVEYAAIRERGWRRVEKKG